MGSLSKASFIEFKIHRFRDLVVIVQTHLYDVIAKWLLMIAVANLLFWYLFKFQVLFFLSFIFVFVGVLWLSKYIRYFALRINLWKRGHNFKVLYVKDSEVIERLLLEVSDGTVRSL
jgi:hypothetical protein